MRTDRVLVGAYFGAQSQTGDVPHRRERQPHLVRTALASWNLLISVTSASKGSTANIGLPGCSVDPLAGIKQVSAGTRSLDRPDFLAIPRANGSCDFSINDVKKSVEGLGGGLQVAEN